MLQGENLNQDHIQLVEDELFALHFSLTRGHLDDDGYDKVLNR